MTRGSDGWYVKEVTASGSTIYFRIKSENDDYHEYGYSGTSSNKYNLALNTEYTLADKGNNNNHEMNVTVTPNAKYKFMIKGNKLKIIPSAVATHYTKTITGSGVSTINVTVKDASNNTIATKTNLAKTGDSWNLEFDAYAAPSKVIVTGSYDLNKEYNWSSTIALPDLNTYTANVDAANRTDLTAVNVTIKKNSTVLVNNQAMTKSGTNFSYAYKTFNADNVPTSVTYTGTHLNVTESWSGSSNTYVAPDVSALLAYSLTKVELMRDGGTTVGTLFNGSTGSTLTLTISNGIRYYLKATLTNGLSETKNEFYYFNGEAITADGTYAMTKETTHTNYFSFDALATSAKVSASIVGDNVVGISVSNLVVNTNYNGIHAIELWNCIGGISKVADLNSFERKGTTFTGVVTIEKYHSSNWSARYVLKANKKTGNSDDWKVFSVERDGTYHGAKLLEGTTYTNVFETDKYGGEEGNGGKDHFYFDTANDGQVLITIELNPSNLYTIKSFKYVPYKGKIDKVQLFTCDGTKSVGTFSAIDENTYVLSVGDIKPRNIDGNWDERYFIRAFAGNNTTDFFVSNYKAFNANGLPADTEATLTEGTGGGNNDYFRFRSGGSLRITVTVDPTNDSRLATIKYSEGGLHFQPKVVRDNDGDDSAWKVGESVVFITGDYLNNNQLVPDWEMDYNPATKRWEIIGVTLRGNQNTSAAQANKVITANVLTKTAASGKYTTKTFTCTPPDLETASERQYGRRYNLYFTYNGTTGSLTADPYTDKTAPFISLIGFNYQQAIDGPTPRGKLTSGGWQEAWVLYEGNNPLRDNDGNYFYSTQWPPKSNIRFKAIKGSETMTLTSDRLTFHRDVNSANSTKDVKSGQQWMTDLKAADSEAYANLALDASTQYARYVVDKAWVLGATKVWTGWGAQNVSGKDQANWSGHQNWGHSDKKYDNNDGTEIKPYATHNVECFGGNFKFDKPTYFQTFELFIPSSTSDGLPVSGADTATKVYTTAAYGEAQIAARDNANFEGQYAATISLPDGAYIKPGTLTITRYWANTSGGYKMAGTLDDNNAVTVVSPTIKQVADGYNVQSSDYVTDAALNNGSYFYQMTLTVVDNNNKEHKIVVESNVFTIANYNMKAHVEPLQLLVLNEAKATAYGHPYITFRAANNGEYYFVDADETCVVATKAQYDDILSSRANYKFSARFFVKALDGADYTEVFKGAPEVKGYQSRPDVYVINGRDAMTNADAVDANKAVRSANRVYGKIIDTVGDLTPKDYTAGMQFWYNKLKAGSTTQFDVINRYVPDTYDSDRVSPEMPTPWGASYKYVHNQTSTDMTDGGNYDYCKITVPLTNVTGETAEVYIDAAELDPRNLNCEIEFHRPNITDAVIAKYDVQYKIHIESSDDELISVTGIFHDTNTDGTSPETYKLTIENVHPTKAIFPTLHVMETKYVENAPGDNTSYDATYGSDIKVIAVQESKKEYPGKFNVNWHGSYDRTAKKVTWTYKGHSDFEDPGDVLHGSTTGTEAQGDKTSDNVRLTPRFYLIEASGTNGEHNHYCHLVEHIEGHTLEATDPDPLIDNFVLPNYEPWAPPVITVTPIYIFNRTVKPEGVSPASWINLTLIGDLEYDTTPAANPAPRRAAGTPTSVQVGTVPSGNIRDLDADVDGNGLSNFVAAPGGGKQQEVTPDSQVTGIEDLLNDANGDVEYYNLQGMRVINPEAGQIYIIRQGAKATKTLVK